MTLVLLTNWTVSNSKPVACGPGYNNVALAITAKRDLIIRSIRYQFDTEFARDESARAYCLAGEVDPFLGGRPVAPRGITRGLARSMMRVAERLPVAIDPHQVPHGGEHFWTWAPGMVIRQLVPTPHDFFMWSGRIEVPAGASLAFLATANRPAAVTILVGGS